jgi:hypothetical protein
MFIDQRQSLNSFAPIGARHAVNQRLPVMKTLRPDETQDRNNNSL